MFAVLNLRWMVDLREREMAARAPRVAGNPQPRWLRALRSWLGLPS
jgi:hypothetical protein